MGISQTHALLEETPTSVAVRAVKQALDRAGIAADKIGQIVGDNSTPIETTPSEAQRVGEALGLKIPCFDITGGSGALLVHLNSFRRTKAERVPEYVVCLTTSMATTRVDYRRGQERFLFGDGAVAVVLSCAHKGKLKIEHTSMTPTPAYRHTISLPMYGLLSVLFPSAADVASVVTGELKSIATKVNGLAGSFVVPPQLNLEIVKAVEEMASLSPDKVWWSGRDHGYTFGSSSLLPLALRWDTIAKGDQIVVVDAGTGPHCCSVVVRGES